MAREAARSNRLVPVVHPDPSPLSWIPDRHPARRGPDRHPVLCGRMFVYGACAWCDDPFMSLCTDWAHRSLYCSPRCAKSAGRGRHGRFNPRPADRLRIYERDGWVCQLCWDPVDPSEAGIWRATLDHIVPQSAGGDHSDGNLRLAHLWCNSVRGDGRYHADMFAEVRV